MNPIFLTTLLVLLAFVIADQVMRRRAYKAMESLYARHRTDELLAYLDRRYVRMFFPAYNRTYMRFNAYQQAGDTAAAGTVLDELLGAGGSREQRSDLVVRAFEFYLKNGERERARAMLDEIAADGGRPDVARECEKVYEIVAEGSSSYIEEMEREVEGADGPTKRRLYYLLSLQYDSRGDARRGDRCREALRALGTSTSR